MTVLLKVRILGSIPDARYCNGSPIPTFSNSGRTLKSLLTFFFFFTCRHWIIVPEQRETKHTHSLSSWQNKQHQVLNKPTWGLALRHSLAEGCAFILLGWFDDRLEFFSIRTLELLLKNCITLKSSSTLKSFEGMSEMTRSKAFVFSAS